MKHYKSDDEILRKLKREDRMPLHIVIGWVMLVAVWVVLL